MYKFRCLGVCGVNFDFSSLDALSRNSEALTSDIYYLLWETL